MTLEWREQYDWFCAVANRQSPWQWELVDPADPWKHYGVITRQGDRRYVATSNCAGLPQPTKTFRSLKQAKAWVQAMAVLNQ